MIKTILLALLIIGYRSEIAPRQNPPPAPTNQNPPPAPSKQNPPPAPSNQNQHHAPSNQNQHPAPQDEILQLLNFTRSYDGSNNNQANSNWGAVGQPLQRIATAAYVDGLNSPIISGKPNVRQVSNLLCAQTDPITQDTQNRSIVVVIFGQFVNHDLDLVPTQTNGQTMAINVPACDAHFDTSCTGTVTLPFSRSQFVNGTSSARNQISGVSSFLDLSTVYGSSSTTANSLRSFQNGKLKTSSENLLPTQVSNGFTQYLAGDQRVNQNIALTTMHTIFMREHNRICDRVVTANSSLSDESVFQIARNYVIGLYQKIVYDQYILEILGRKLAPYQAYNQSVNPTTFNQFLTAAFRFGHPTIYDDYFLINQNNQNLENLTLSQIFFNPARVNQTSFDWILRGLIHTPAKQRDLTAIDDIRNMLILSPGSTIKLDLLAINTQRGRDHGLPDFNTLNTAMGLPQKRFQALNSAQAQNIKSLYNTDSNIDAFIGMLAQPNFQGGMMGHLAWNIIQKSFLNLRDGDRYFWQSNFYPGKIQKQFHDTTLMDVFARNSRVTGIPLNVFKRLPKIQ